jgi:hypothetical protein
MDVVRGLGAGRENKRLGEPLRDVVAILKGHVAGDHDDKGVVDGGVSINAFNVYAGRLEAHRLDEVTNRLLNIGKHLLRLKGVLVSTQPSKKKKASYQSHASLRSQQSTYFNQQQSTKLFPGLTIAAYQTKKPLTLIYYITSIIYAIDYLFPYTGLLNNPVHT